MTKKITLENNPKLFQVLKDNCDFDVDHISKHGKGNVHVKSQDDQGNLYECFTEWDYSWGIEWTYGYQEWNKVSKHENICPCCNQIIK